MKDNLLWNNFLKSGKIDDYLKYIHSENDKAVIINVADKDTWTDN